MVVVATGEAAELHPMTVTALSHTTNNHSRAAQLAHQGIVCDHAWDPASAAELLKVFKGCTGLPGLACGDYEGAHCDGVRVQPHATHFGQSLRQSPAYVALLREQVCVDKMKDLPNLPQ